MIENYKQTIEEFKRVDHLFHVSLKYTRTVDVIRSVVERLISVYENGCEVILLILEEEKKIGEIPDSPVMKANVVKEHTADESIKKTLDIYLMLRRLMRMSFGRVEEFRRHVTMIVEDFEGEEVHVDIDLLKEYYDMTTEFLTHLKQLIEPYKHLDDD